MDKNIEDAFRFIDSELKADPNTDKARLVEIACQRFNLTPLQGEFLTKKFVHEQ
ncbi:MAG: hypothetical protein JXA20_16720 [Spirochaetes bacterium]|nr:hypothetical protein [Spirochaetota bacterium]